MVNFKDYPRDIKDKFNKEEILCNTCKKVIKRNEYFVDDGIKKDVFHHINCY